MSSCASENLVGAPELDRLRCHEVLRVSSGTSIKKQETSMLFKMKMIETWY